MEKENVEPKLTSLVNLEITTEVRDKFKKMAHEKSLSMSYIMIKLMENYIKNPEVFEIDMRLKGVWTIINNIRKSCKKVEK